MVQNVTIQDPTRPVTFATSQQWNTDVAVSIKILLNKK